MSKQQIYKIGEFKKTVDVTDEKSNSIVSLIDEKDIPEDWEFDLSKKTGIVNYNNYVLKFKIPNIADSIAIESRKSLLSRGQYTTMAISVIDSQSQVINIIDAVCILQVVCEFPKDFPNADNLVLSGDEQVPEILSIYEMYLKWKEFFRSLLEKTS